MSVSKRIIISLVTGAVMAILAALIHQQLNGKRGVQRYKVKATIAIQDHGHRDTVSRIIGNRLSRITDNFELDLSDATTTTITAGEITDTALFKRILVESAEIRFSELYTMFEVMTSFQQVIADDEKDHVSQINKTVITDSSKVSQYFPEDAVVKKESTIAELLQIYSPIMIGEQTSYQGNIGQVYLTDTSALVQKLEKYKGRFPQNIEFAFGRPINPRVKNEQEKIVEFYCLKRNTGYGITSDQFKSIKATFDDITARPVLSLTFDKEGTMRWENMTKANKNQPIAIIINNEVITAPTVIEPIIDGRSVISGNFTTEEVTELSVLLGSGPLPTDVKLVKFNAKKEAGIPWRPVIFFVVAAGLAYWMIGLLKPSKSIDS